MNTYTPPEWQVIWRELPKDYTALPEAWASIVSNLVEEEENCQLSFVHIVVGAEGEPTIAVWKKIDG